MLRPLKTCVWFEAKNRAGPEKAAPNVGLLIGRWCAVAMAGLPVCDGCEKYLAAARTLWNSKPALQSAQQRETAQRSARQWARITFRIHLVRPSQPASRRKARSRAIASLVWRASNSRFLALSLSQIRPSHHHPSSALATDIPSFAHSGILCDAHHSPLEHRTASPLHIRPSILLRVGPHQRADRTASA
ncbi:hypothetical protein L1887_53678 [Cichorium endivia]|nr:hypothetical protein L1887_53678 [Cichorium endivia]